MEYTETEMDAIHEKWFMSGYKSGYDDGYLDGRREITARYIARYKEANPEGTITVPIEMLNDIEYIKFDTIKDIPTGDNRFVSYEEGPLDWGDDSSCAHRNDPCEHCGKDFPLKGE